MSLTALLLIRKRGVEGSGSMLPSGQLSLLKVGKLPMGVMWITLPLTLLRGGKTRPVYTWSKYACQHGWCRRMALLNGTHVCWWLMLLHRSLCHYQGHFPHPSSFPFLCLYVSLLVLLSSLSLKHPFLGAEPHAGEVRQQQGEHLAKQDAPPRATSFHLLEGP